jgi:hypothetical protein
MESQFYLTKPSHNEEIKLTPTGKKGSGCLGDPVFLCYAPSGIFFQRTDP